MTTTGAHPRAVPAPSLGAGRPSIGSPLSTGIYS